MPVVVSGFVRSPWDGCLWTKRASSDFSKLGRKNYRLKALLLKGVKTLIAGSSSHNIKKIQGVRDVYELVINKDGGIRIYFARRGRSLLVLYYGDKNSQERDIEWVSHFLKNNPLPFLNDY